MCAFSFQQSYEYDIAVLRMVRPVDFQPNAIPICLPRNNDELVGRIGSVTGKFLNEPTNYFKKFEFPAKDSAFRHLNKKHDERTCARVKVAWWKKL